MAGPPHRKQVQRQEVRKDISILFKMKDIEEVNKNATFMLYYIINLLRMFVGLKSILTVARN